MGSKNEIKLTQCDRILEHFHNYGSITQREADDLYGITRLGARVYNLKKMGYTIDAKTEHGVNRYGEKTRFTRYYLIK